MRQDQRAPFVSALDVARRAAYPSGEYVGQESFMRVGEIRQLAHRAGITAGSSVLDVCCGIAGPGRLITAEFGCHYTGVDYSSSALDIARELAGDLPCHFTLAHVPPLPTGRFEVVLLFETMLAFPDKRQLLAEVARALEPGGRFACTVEAGKPLTAAERALMPDDDTVWLLEIGSLVELLTEAGLTVTWQQDWSTAHHQMAVALLGSMCADSTRIAEDIGAAALADLVAAHRLWADWLGSGRVRKFAVVAVKDQAVKR